MFEEAFDLHSSLADSVRLEPVDLGFSYRTIRETYYRYTLELSLPFALQPIQPLQNVNAAACRDGFYGMNFTDYFEFQAFRLTQHMPLSAQLLGITNWWDGLFLGP